MGEISMEFPVLKTQIKQKQNIQFFSKEELPRIRERQQMQFSVMKEMMNGLQEISLCPLTENAASVMKDIAANTLQNVNNLLDVEEKSNA